MTTEAQKYAGVTFDGKLIEAVQRAVMAEGVLPSHNECTGALFAAYRGLVISDVTHAAAREVWANRHEVLKG